MTLAARPRAVPLPGPPQSYAGQSDAADKRRLLLLNLPHANATAPGHNGFFINIGRPAMGIALSGGGIRSATIALGAVQALAQQQRLLDFDYMSTVSGGGYTGSFLGSLFLPQDLRDKASTLPLPAATITALDRRCAFALTALTLPPNAAATQTDEVDAAGNPASQPGQPPTAIRSPIRWLRENSRYLAPNGPTDYLIAASYLSRNWLAMIYVFMIFVSAAFMLLTLAMLRIVLALNASPETHALVGPLLKPQASPLLWPALLLLALAISAGGAYWSTDGAQELSRKVHRIGYDCIQALIGLVMILIAAGIAAAYVLLPYARGNFTPGSSACPAHSSPCKPVDAVQVWAGSGTAGGQPLTFAWHPAEAAVLQHGISQHDVVVVLAGLAVTILAIAGAMAIAFAVLTRSTTWRRFYFVDLRRLLTQYTARCNWWFLAVAGLAVIDTLGLRLHNIVLNRGWSVLWTGLTAALGPAGAWFINRFMTARDGKAQGTGLVSRWRNAIALVAGIVLFGTLAVVADTTVHFIVWPAEAWPIDLAASGLDTLHWSVIGLFGGTIVMLMLATGWSTGFINLSSLHGLYMTRLTRTYLGAANPARMCRVEIPGPDGNIRDSDTGDDPAIAIYQQWPTAAPVHLINVTLNQTVGRDGADVVERDRKGMPIVFAPEGVLVDAAVAANQGKAPGAYQFDWTTVDQSAVESLSLGQLCAISGAAVSTGMGANTSLGMALTLTFANARLGYWWHVRNLLSAGHPLFRLPGTYGYLYDEMLAQFRTDTDRVYLSDGGHFENSGAYELLRRQVPLIVVLDNGADPEYTFEDLENLVRKARLDMGLTITTASIGELNTHIVAGTVQHFLNLDPQGWRHAVHDPENNAFALLLKVIAPQALTPRWIVWIKPRVLISDAIDICGYAHAHATFPQETTANQFFSEDQWESYRMIGERAIDRLLSGNPNLFRNLA